MHELATACKCEGMIDPSVATDPTIIQLIVVGGAGGCVAAISAALVTWIAREVRDQCLMRRIRIWLTENSKKGSLEAPEFRSTRAIASYNNLTEDQVRYLCSRSKKIFLSTGSKEDLWSVHSRETGIAFDVL